MSLTSTHVQAVAQLPAEACIPKRNEAANIIKEPIDFFVGNIIGVSPLLAVLVLTVAGVALLFTFRQQSAPRWLKVIGMVIMALLVIVLAPTVVYAITDANLGSC